MGKPEWGTKRTCLNCGVRFYDLGNKPITCPACETSFEPEAFVKTRRSRQSAPEEPKKVAPSPKVAEGETEEAADGEDNLDIVASDDEDDVDEEEDDTVLPAEADEDDDSDDLDELIDKPDGSKEEG